MYLLEAFTRLLARFHYPVSLPEDIAKDLGVHLANSLSFDEFLLFLSSPHMRPAKLRKYISRRRAEGAFQSYSRREVFPSCTLYSYYFNRGWVVIALHFDEEEKLRRVYFQCPASAEIEGFNLFLESEARLYAHASSQ